MVGAAAGKQLLLAEDFLMSNFENVSLSKNRELLQKDENAAETFLRSAVHTGLQTPLNGAAQLMDRSTGTNILPNVQFIDAPVKESTAANLGSATATVGHCALMLAAGHKIVGPVDSVGAFSQRALLTGGMGALYGGVFTPVGNDGDFLKSRFSNALSGSAGLAGMSAMTSLYKDVIGKGVSFVDAPFYKGLLIPASLGGVAVMADQTFSGDAYNPGYNSVFMPGAKLRQVESYIKPSAEKKR